MREPMQARLLAAFELRVARMRIVRTLPGRGAHCDGGALTLLVLDVIFGATLTPRQTHLEVQKIAPMVSSCIKGF